MVRLLVLALFLATPGIDATAGSLGPNIVVDSTFWCGSATLCGAPGLTFGDSLRMPQSKDTLAVVLPLGGGATLAIGSAQSADGNVRVYLQRFENNGAAPSAGRVILPTPIVSVDDAVLDGDTGFLLVLATATPTSKSLIRVAPTGVLDPSFGTGGVYSFSDTGYTLGRGQVARLPDERILAVAGASRASPPGNFLASWGISMPSGLSIEEAQMSSAQSGSGAADFHSLVIGPSGDPVAVGNLPGGAREVVVHQSLLGPSNIGRTYYGTPTDATCTSNGAGVAVTTDAVALDGNRLIAVGTWVSGFSFHSFAATWSIDAASFGLRTPRCEGSNLGAYLSAVAIDHPYPSSPTFALPIAVSYENTESGTQKRMRWLTVAPVGDEPLFGERSEPVTWPNATTSGGTPQPTLLGGADDLLVTARGRYVLGTSRQWSGDDWDYALARYTVDRLFADGFND